MQRHVWMLVACFSFISSLATGQEKTGLPAGAVARLGIPRFRVPAPIVDAAFACDSPRPEQSVLAMVYQEPNGKQPNVVLFDLATGAVRDRFLVPHASQLAAATRKPLIVVAGNHEKECQFELWDLAASRHVRSWRTPGSLQALSISSDGSQIIAALGTGKQSILARWNGAGEKLPVLEIPANLITALSFSADGTKLLAASFGSAYGMGSQIVNVPGQILAWDGRTGKKLSELDNLSDHVVFSQDGSRVARSIKDKTIEVFDIPSGKRLADIAVPHARFAFTPDGKQLAILGSNEPIRLWDIASNKEARSFEGKAWSARNLRPRFTADGKLLAVMMYEGMINYAELWDMPSGKRVRYPSGFSSTVNGLAYAPDGRTLTAISSDTLINFDARTGEELRRWIGHNAAIEQIAYSPDGKQLASASVDGTIALWDPATGKQQKRLAAGDSVESIAFSRDGATLISAGKNRKVQLWHVEKGTVLQSYVIPLDGVTTCLSADAEHLAYFLGERGRFGGGSLFTRLHAPTGKVLPNLPLRRSDDREGFEGTLLWGVAFSADGKMIATSDSVQTFDLRMSIAHHMIRVWESATRTEILRFTNNPVGTRLLLFSPDGRTLAHGIGQRGAWGYGRDQTIILRDIAAAQSVQLGKEEGRWGVDLDDLKKVYCPLDGHQGSVTCMAFSPGSRFLATGGSDQVAFIWRVDDFLKPSPVETKADLPELWANLSGPSSARAYQAIGVLERRPRESLELLRKHLRPVPIADEKLIAQHLHNLASANFVTRQQAYTALERIGEQATHILQKAAKTPPNLEVKRRLETLLDRFNRPLDEPDQIRNYRSLTLLERIGTPEARQLLREIGQGAPAAWLTLEANHALRRMK